MKKIFLRYTRKQLAVLAGGLCSLTACVDEGLNIDAYHITDEQLMADANEGGYLLPVMMNFIVPTSTALQTVQNLQAESYAGYMESPTNFLNNVNTMTYFMVSGWNNNSWYSSTNNVMNNWLLMKRSEIDVKYPDLYAIATIIKVAAVQRLVDTFGPYPYTQYGEGSEVPFDSEEEAYNAFFSDLDEAVTALQAAEAADPNADMVRFAKWDRSSLGGEYTSWIKAANSLRLRMAMRISGVSPAKAQQEAEKAVAEANGGILDRAFEIILTATNPYYTFATAWSDTRLSASIETYLTGFEDPRLEAYALPATGAGVVGQFKGIRPGVAKPDKDRYIGYSLPNISQADPIKVIDVAEGYFLKAEGVLRGWNMGGGTAQQYYEDGIRASFTYNGVSGVDEYLLSTGTQIAYVDPRNTANNSAPISTVTVQWNEAASFEQKLEKIITQKWIAIYPEGTEAWSEFRRTGYPRMYPIMVTNNPDLPLGTFIKRLTYPLTVISASGQAVANAVSQHLGGNDSAATPLWWDVD
ncbi:SusD/RagB family nutrient-binding outer membrane lipoprotein [Olivibacter sitiensis]|uniref:SusD/RagB family nutrient-binding outer membrane lipoprotein n=1 Tax=Olivibacter sitiensis TaxID=376470 RepID=UPI000411A10D|nr:SusD/RagB family nutrient-binding outer membrane lipoprotein [Olivibacter sitiensis]